MQNKNKNKIIKKQQKKHKKHQQHAHKFSKNGKFKFIL